MKHLLLGSLILSLVSSTSLLQAEDETSTLVYSNTQGEHIFGPNAGLRVADDMMTTVVSGCSLDKFVFRVSGDKFSNAARDEGPFSVAYALYPSCPSGSAYPIPITGTVGTVDFPDEGIYDVEVVMPSANTCVGGVNDGQPCATNIDCPNGTCVDDVALPSTFYFAVIFSRDKAGIFVGGVPTLGMSLDRFDFPGYGCDSNFGGFPQAPHGSFSVEFYVRGDCTPSFPGYRNGGTSMRYPALTGVVYADDINLGVDVCNMVAYEVAVRGELSGSSGAVQVQLHESLDPSDPLNIGMIPGTRRQKFIFGNSMQMLRADFSTPIRLPVGQTLYLVFKAGSSVVGPLGTLGVPSIGYTGAAYPRPRPGVEFTGIDLTIFCEGTASTGACCDNVYLDDWTCVGGSTPDAPCSSDDDCACLPCADGRCDAYECDGGPDPGSFCVHDRDCECPRPRCTAGVCDGGPHQGAACVVDADCRIPPYCTEDGICIGESVCRETPQWNCPNPETWVLGGRCGPICVGGVNDGAACTAPADCPSVCAGGPNGRLPCATDADCPDGACADSTCEGAFCVYGLNDGLPCTQDADCPDGSCVPVGFATDVPCGIGACCGCIGGVCEFGSECAEFTERECIEETQGVGHLFNLGDSCDNTDCPWGACIGGSGDCSLPRETVCRGGDRDGEPCDPDGYSANECPPGFPVASCPGVAGCGDPLCCTEVCAVDSFCCDVWWDEWCVASAYTVCQLPPSNDTCVDTADPTKGAKLLRIPTVMETTAIWARNDPDEPGFCCKEGDPGGQGVGTTWFKFVAPHLGVPTAETVSVKISTCGSTGRSIDGVYYPADDSMIQVFSISEPDLGKCRDHSACSVSQQDCSDESACVMDPLRACENLIPIACNDDTESGCPIICWIGYGESQLCIPDLVVGQTYYFMVAAKAEENRGIYRVAITAPCGPRWPWFPDACTQLGDYDHDADIDGADYNRFAQCLDTTELPDSPTYLRCLDVFDADTPGTIDLRDFAAFQRAFTD